MDIFSHPYIQNSGDNLTGGIQLKIQNKRKKEIRGQDEPWSGFALTPVWIKGVNKAVGPGK